jgi:hypothetical protein
MHASSDSELLAAVYLVVSKRPISRRSRAEISPAGGFDAIWVLVVDLADSSIPSAINEVENVWLGWTEMSVSPLTAEASVDRGLRVEELEKVERLVEAIRA